MFFIAGISAAHKGKLGTSSGKTAGLGIQFSASFSFSSSCCGFTSVSSPFAAAAVPGGARNGAGAAAAGLVAPPVFDPQVIALYKGKI